MLQNNGFEPILRFVVCSDTHFSDTFDIHTRNFINGMEQAYSISDSYSYNKLDAVFICGDTVIDGKESEFRHFKDTVDTVFRQETEVSLLYGGHECGIDGEAAAAERFRRIYKQEPNCHKIIKGYHFLMLSTKANNARESYTDEQKAWLKSELEKAAKDAPRKPVFIFHHPNLRNTVWGSPDWSNPGIESIVINYPQVISFSGHSHYPINAPTSIYQKYFTALSTGSFDTFDGDSYYKISHIRAKRNGGLAAQFYFVEVDAESRVRIYPYDAVSRSFYGIEWKIDKAYDTESYLYTDKIRYCEAKAPRFVSDELIIEKVSKTSVKLKFKEARAAYKNDAVKEYSMLIKRKSDGAVVKQALDWANFYEKPYPEYYEGVIEGLCENTEYTVTVKAIGFFENESEETLCGEFAL